MLINSVANNWDTPDKTTVTGSADQTLNISGALPGLLSVLIMADVDIHISKGVASTNKFLLLANPSFEIPVKDIAIFHFWGTAAGNLYIIEWRG